MGRRTPEGIRSLVFTALLDINPEEFGGLTTREASVMITDVVDALSDLAYPCTNVYRWCVEYNRELTPLDYLPGYYGRYVACLMANPTNDAYLGE